MKEIMDLPATAKQLPLVTIAIPTFNRAKSLRKAIDSALAQSYEAIEVVVSDNASTDDTLGILESYQDSRFRYVRQETNIGLIGNWNACLHLATGEYYIILSDDDALVSSAIYDLVSGFYEDIRAVDLFPKADVAFVYGQCRIDNKVKNTVHLSASAPLIEPSIEYQIATLRSKRVSYPSATLIRTSDALGAGGYKLCYPAGADSGLVFEISSKYPKVAFTGRITTEYNFHPQNFTSSVKVAEYVETLGLLTQCSLDSLLKESWIYKRRIENAGMYAQANALVYGVVQNAGSNNFELNQVAAQFLEFRELFSNTIGMWILLKGLLKVVRAILVRSIRKMASHKEHGMV